VVEGCLKGLFLFLLGKARGKDKTRPPKVGKPLNLYPLSSFEPCRALRTRVSDVVLNPPPFLTLILGCRGCMIPSFTSPQSAYVESLHANLACFSLMETPPIFPASPSRGQGRFKSEEVYPPSPQPKIAAHKSLIFRVRT